MAIGARPVGRGLEQQLRPLADHLVGHIIDDCGHIIPLHRPKKLLSLLEPFLASPLPTVKPRADAGAPSPALLPPPRT